MADLKWQNIPTRQIEINEALKSALEYYGLEIGKEYKAWPHDYIECLKYVRDNYDSNILLLKPGDNWTLGYHPDFSNCVGYYKSPTPSKHTKLLVLKLRKVYLSCVNCHLHSLCGIAYEA